MTVSEVAYPRPWGRCGPVWVGEAGLLSWQPLKSSCGRLMKEVCAFSLYTLWGGAPTLTVVRVVPCGLAPVCFCLPTAGLVLSRPPAVIVCTDTRAHTRAHACRHTHMHMHRYAHPPPPSTQTRFTITVWGGGLVWAGWAGGGGPEGGGSSGEVCARVWHLGWGR